MKLANRDEQILVKFALAAKDAIDHMNEVDPDGNDDFVCELSVKIYVSNEER